MAATHLRAGFDHGRSVSKAGAFVRPWSMSTGRFLLTWDQARPVEYWALIEVDCWVSDESRSCGSGRVGSRPR